MEPTEITEAKARSHTCSHCGAPDSYRVEQVDDPVFCGTNVVLVPLTAEVCMYCGNELIDVPAMQKLDAAYAKLKSGDLSGWERVGEVYKAS